MNLLIDNKTETLHTFQQKKTKKNQKDLIRSNDVSQSGVHVT